MKRPEFFPSRNILYLASIAVLLFALPAPAVADIYRWQDESGGLHFTDDLSSVQKRAIGRGRQAAGRPGRKRLKMVVAVDPENPKVDTTRVEAVRDAVGDDVELMIDANYLFSFNRALELCKLVEPLGITWFEEPVYQNDALLLADLRRHTSIPIAAGQNEGHRFRHRELIANHAVDIAQPNVCSVGGYTEAVKVAALAQAFNLPIANGGGWPHHNMHLQAAMANGWRVEFHFEMWGIGDKVFKEPADPVNGWVTLPETPGLGLEPRFDALEEYEEK